MAKAKKTAPKEGGEVLFKFGSDREGIYVEGDWRPVYALPAKVTAVNKDGTLDLSIKVPEQYGREWKRPSVPSEAAAEAQAVAAKDYIRPPKDDEAGMLRLYDRWSVD